MTILTGNLQSISGNPFGGPGCSVLVFSRITRPGFSVDGLILQLQDRIPMPTSAGGVFQTEDLDPGPIRVELEGGTVHGQGWDIDLPEEGTHSLANLIDAQVEWAPAVVGRAEAAAALAGSEADRAVEGAVRAESAAVLLESALPGAADLVRAEVASDADRAEHAREGAEAAQAGAEAAQVAAEGAASATAAVLRQELDAEASRAEAAASASLSHAQAAEASASSAGSSATSADGRAVAAAGSMTAASDYAAAASSAEEQAGLHAQAALQSKQDAADSAQAAAGSATTADGHRQAAAEHEAGAQAAQTAAEVARDAAQQAADNAQAGAPPEGWQKSDLAATVQESLSRADTALQSMPDATATARGVLRLAGDLGGSASAPTVPGLAGKADTGHKHVSADTTDSVDTTTASSANAGRLVKLDATGRLRAPAPSASAHVATKAYVDSGLASKSDSGHSHSWEQIQGKPTAFPPTPRTVPMVIPWDGEGTWTAPAGVIATDRVLNEQTGEIHSVQEM